MDSCFGLFDILSAKELYSLSFFHIQVKMGVKMWIRGESGLDSHLTAVTFRVQTPWLGRADQVHKWSKQPPTSA